MSDVNVNITIEEELINVNLDTEATINVNYETGVATESGTHNHDSRYYTEDEVDALLSTVPTLPLAQSDVTSLVTTLEGKQAKHGFENRTDSTLSTVGTDFVITGSHNVFRHGVKITKGNGTVAIPAGDGMYFVYYDSLNDLTISAAPWTFGTDIMIALVFKSGASYIIGDERHGLFDAQTHKWAHNVFNMLYARGLSGVFSNTTFEVGSGTVYDEDIEHTIPTTTQSRIFYRANATEMTFTAKQANPYLIGGVLQYDNGGVLTPLPSNAFMAFWVFATNFVDNGVIILAGQRSDNTIALARTNNTPGTIAYANLIAPEMKLLYRVIVRNDATPYEEAVDYRSTSVSGTTVVVTDHQTLSNRGATDSHPIAAITGLDDRLDYTQTAGEVINGHRLVYLKDGLAYKASNDNPECFNRVIGMSVNAALLGDTVNVKKGKVENPGWALTANTLYYLGLDGNITATPPTAGILQAVGYSTTTDKFYVNTNIAIRR